MEAALGPGWRGSPVLAALGARRAPLPHFHPQREEGRLGLFRLLGKLSAQ